MLGGFGADLGDLAEAAIAGGEEVFGELGGENFCTRGPDGEHGGLFGKVPPLLDDVVDVKLRPFLELRGEADGGSGCEPFSVGAGADMGFRCDRYAQRCVADDQGGVGVSEHVGDIVETIAIVIERRGFQKFGGHLPAAGGEDFGERLRAAGVGVERNAAGLADGEFGDQQEAAHALLGGDGQAREDGQARDALVLDGGNDGDVGGAGAEGFGALRGDGEGEVVLALEGAVSETADERRGVEILHDGDAEFAHGRLCEVRSGLFPQRAALAKAPTPKTLAGSV